MGVERSDGKVIRDRKTAAAVRFLLGTVATCFLATACSAVRITPTPLPPLTSGEGEESPSDSLSSEALYHAMRFHLAVGERNGQNALSEIEKAVELDPRSPFLHSTLAMLYVYMNRMDDAMGEIDKALALNPGYLPARRLQARLYAGADPLKAAEAYQKILESHPDDEEAVFGLVGIWSHEKKYEEAVHLLEGYLDRNPDSYQALRALAELAVVRKDTAGVERSFQKLLRLNPGSPHVLGDLGRFYEEEGNLDAAIETYRKILEQRPSRSLASSVRRRLARIFIQQGRLDDAILELQEIEKLEGGRTDAKILLGLIYLEQKHYDEAIEHFRKIQAENPADETVAYYLGTSYADSGKNNPAAIEELKKITPVSKDFTDARVRLGLLLAEERRLDEALAIAKEAIVEVDKRVDETKERAEPNERDEPEVNGEESGEEGEGETETESLQDSGAPGEEGATASGQGTEQGGTRAQEKTRLLRVLAYIHEKANRSDLAIEALRQAVAIAPRDAKIRFDLAVALDKAGQGPECVAEMQKVIELNPEDASALNYLGYTWAEKGVRLDEAEAMIKRALVLEPEDGYFVDSLGWVYYKKGHMQDAVTELERAVKIVPDDPVVTEHLGDAYLGAGQKERALQLFERALNLHGKGEEETSGQDDAEREANLKKKIQELGGEVPASPSPPPPPESRP